MRTSTGAPTKADRERFLRLQELGCVVMRLFHNAPESPADVHHVLSGGRRLGHQQTIPLSPWFHRGLPPAGMAPCAAKALFGPSRAREPRAFAERFGTDLELLLVTNELLAAMARSRAA